MKKNDLKTGMKVQFHNNYKAVVIKNINGKNWLFGDNSNRSLIIPFAYFNDDLTNKHIGDEWNIKKVFNIPDDISQIFKKQGKLRWERRKYKKMIKIGKREYSEAIIKDALEQYSK